MLRIGRHNKKICIEEECRQGPNQEEKFSAIKDLETYAMSLFARI